MNAQNQINKIQNIPKNKMKENQKMNINKPIGSSIYSKNKKSLEKMLREYQIFCKKYFGESTPIGAMTEERMNKLLEDENNLKETNLLEEDKQHFLDTLEDNVKEDFSLEENCDKLPLDIFYNENNVLGNHKNNKNDYKQRNKILFNEISSKEEKIDNEEYNDFEQKEESDEFKNKEMIYSGYDKEKSNFLKIYIDALENNGNIIKIVVNNHSLNDNKNKIIKLDIKNLLEVESISKEELSKNLQNLVDKIFLIIKVENNENNENKISKENNNDIKEKEEGEKVLDEDGEEYTF